MEQYNIYAYGRGPQPWLSTDLILSQFAGTEDHLRSYREKAQKYAIEEKRIFEDLRHGLILGSKQCVEKIRKKYAPEGTELSLPQQRQVARTFDPANYLGRAEEILKCDIEHFVDTRRLSRPKKESRDMILYGIWRTGYKSENRNYNFQMVSIRSASK